MAPLERLRPLLSASLPIVGPTWLPSPWLIFPASLLLLLLVLTLSRRRQQSKCRKIAFDSSSEFLAKEKGFDNHTPEHTPPRSSLSCEKEERVFQPADLVDDEALQGWHAFEAGSQGLSDANQRLKHTYFERETPIVPQWNMPATFQGPQGSLPQAAGEGYSGPGHWTVWHAGSEMRGRGQAPWSNMDQTWENGNSMQPPRLQRETTQLFPGGKRQIWRRRILEYG
ncbi:hypothetical protein AJ80_06286 [Polytolypa hystricis UAMH7299]|uniref:Uncharacterized protein n=1 Tax=Polytolypa hystricis (strain UAMH7299) TaxID=1447883 RepID=A0A2B7XWG2_POLH7|nr:hypothetical protein AJ80_06286 [Polytolypa hystricis UAMH7299]